MSCPKCGSTMKLVYKRVWECPGCGHTTYVPTEEDVERGKKETKRKQIKP